ncbi:uncharacterized protein [Dermacentor andersoni]|uniref:uncharacterized protein n=1 Tax=Dermacentor andersoni TaxID=34620 RepID=UPI003B3B66C5
MQTETFVQLFLLLVTASQGTCKMVNLAEEAEAYLNKTVSSGWKSWGLDENYEYWTGHHQIDPEHPIFGTVDRFQQDDDCKGPKRTENGVCKEKFIWDVENGIRSPFQLLVNITVHLKNGSSETFQLDLNNATSIVKPKRLGLKKKKVATIQQKKCNFLAEVTFNGSFAYKVKERRGDMPDFFAVGIGKLNDLTKGLQGDYHQILKYNITGIFRHLLICTN